MGQYWKVVNLDKHEYIHPHKLGCGLKLWEQLANKGIGEALIILLAAMPEPRGGGDFASNYDGVVGRWAGDRIALIGDYAEDSDLPKGVGDVPASQIYDACFDDDDPRPAIFFEDITHLVTPVIEHELGVRFTGSGWRERVET